MERDFRDSVGGLNMPYSQSNQYLQDVSDAGDERGKSYIQELIRKETEKAQQCSDTLSIRKSINTIIILDSSSQMNSSQLADAKSTIENFLQGLESNCMNYGLEENIALVTCGVEPFVQQHLTNEYQKIREALQILEPCGSSSLTVAFLLICAVMERCHEIEHPGYRVPPRIILISGGQIPEIDQAELDLVYSVIIEQLRMKIFYVPLGQTNESFSMVTTAVSGEMVLPDDIAYLSRSHIYHSILSAIWDQTGGNIIRQDIKTEFEKQFPDFSDRDIDNVLKLLEGERSSQRQIQHGGFGDVSPAVSAGLTTQTTTSSQLNQPVQVDPSRESPVFVAALHGREQNNLPESSSPSTTPPAPNKQGWITLDRTSVGTTQMPSLEAANAEHAQKDINSRIQQLYQRQVPSAKEHDMPENNQQEGDNLDENKQPNHFNFFGTRNQANPAEAEQITQEKIKELLDKFSEDPKLDNLPKMPRTGLRVTTGPDWMWKQNGVEIGAEGTVVERSRSDEKEDTDYEGWVRVQWDNGVEEDYRYGVDYEFDIQPLENGMNGVEWPSGRERIVKDYEWLDNDDEYLENLQKECRDIMSKANLGKDEDENRRNEGNDNIIQPPSENSAVKEMDTNICLPSSRPSATSIMSAKNVSSTATSMSMSPNVSRSTSVSVSTSVSTSTSVSVSTSVSTSTSVSRSTSLPTATNMSTSASVSTSETSQPSDTQTGTERDVCYIWQYFDEDGEWKTYELENQQKIESAYLRSVISVVINTKKGSERLIFKCMEQRNVNKSTVRPIRRMAADRQTLQELQEMLAS